MAGVGIGPSALCCYRVSRKFSPLSVGYAFSFFLLIRVFPQCCDMQGHLLGQVITSYGPSPRWGRPFVHVTFALLCPCCGLSSSVDSLPFLELSKL